MEGAAPVGSALAGAGGGADDGATMTLLAFDIGSSSVKAGVLRGGNVVGETARAPFRTRFEGVRAEVAPEAVLKAMAAAVRKLGPAARRAELIGLTAMSPSWVAMDKRGKALTPIVTHQDRRSVETARRLEEGFGKQRLLELSGNRPFPGGISSTTCAWFAQNEKGLMKRADLIGHLTTYLHRQLTGARVTDTSNASFMGLYRTLDLGGWSDELCAAVGVSPAVLPEVREAGDVGGTLTREGARRLGLPGGLPMMVGLMDTGAALLLAGAKVGQLLNVSGSTDVLALCTDRPVPHERLLTRGLGVGRRWMSVSTLAAAGSALAWAREQLFADLKDKPFWALVGRLAGRSRRGSGESCGVTFEPYLAGDRMSIEQRKAAFEGLTLATTREEMLSAVIESLAKASAERIDLLRTNPVKVSRCVFVSGGTQGGLAQVLQRDWPGRWTFRAEEEATLKGLAVLAERGAGA